jgi:hypothetical protein
MYKRAILSAYGIWVGVPVENGNPVVGTQWDHPTALVDACALRCLQWRSIARRLQRWWRRVLTRRRSASAPEGALPSLCHVIQRAWRHYCPLSSHLSVLRATIDATNERLAVSFGLCLDAFIVRVLGALADPAG